MTKCHTVQWYKITFEILEIYWIRNPSFLDEFQNFTPKPPEPYKYGFLSLSQRVFEQKKVQVKHAFLIKIEHTTKIVKVKEETKGVPEMTELPERRYGGWRGSTY